MTNNISKFTSGISQSVDPKNLLDVLQASAKDSIDAQKLKKRLLKLMASDEYFLSLTFEEKVRLIKLISDTELDANNFMLNFCKINSQIEGMADVMKQLLFMQVNIQNNNLNQNVIDQTDETLNNTDIAKYVQSLIFNSMDKHRDITRGVEEQ